MIYFNVKPKEFCAPHFQRQSLISALSIFPYVKMSVSGTIPNGLLSPHINPRPCIPSTNLLHSLIVWLTVLSVFSHSQHQQFSYKFLLLSLMTSFSTPINRDSVSLFRFPKCNNVLVISSSNTIVFLLKHSENYKSSHFCFQDNDCCYNFLSLCYICCYGCYWHL